MPCIIKLTMGPKVQIFYLLPSQPALSEISVVWLPKNHWGKSKNRFFYSFFLYIISNSTDNKDWMQYIMYVYFLCGTDLFFLISCLLPPKTIWYFTCGFGSGVDSKLLSINSMLGIIQDKLTKSRETRRTSKKSRYIKHFFNISRSSKESHITYI